jgi:site-specific DNA recombinase
MLCVMTAAAEPHPNDDAALYARISDDKRGEALGVTRQLEDGRALALTRNLRVTAEFVDNSISALKGQHRPQYELLMAGVRAGRFKTIVVFHTSRLWRNRAERAAGMELLRDHGVSLIAVRGPALDMATASGRMLAGILGEFDTAESELKSERIVRALTQNAEAGRPHGRVPYGWRRLYDPETGRGRDIIDQAEADIVREIADRIIHGDSMSAIRNDLNARGIPTPAGKPTWQKVMLRSLVIRERNVGRRVHRGQVLRDGTWPPILAEAKFEQVRAILQDPTRRTSTGSAAKYLLTGIATCGPCGAPIRSATNRSIPSYRCSAKACVSRRRADVDQVVLDHVFDQLSRPDAIDVLYPDRSTEVRAAANTAAELRAQLDVAADQCGDGLIDATQLARITARIRPRLAAAEAASRVVDDAPLLEGLVGNPKLAEVWPTLPITRRRAVVDMLVTVKLLPAGAGARRFDPETVQVEQKKLG